MPKNKPKDLSATVLDLGQTGRLRAARQPTSTPKKIPGTKSAASPATRTYQGSMITVYGLLLAVLLLQFIMVLWVQSWSG